MAKLDGTLQQLMQMFVSHHKSTMAAIRRMEIQIGHLVEKMEEFEVNTKVNPMKECNVVITGSGKVLDERKYEERLYAASNGSDDNIY
ncbi:hypothetical protein LR48_Vigan07g087700 [Vigna angularis]|uniref:Uncharacterized protein n=1 Tax=Phaseolus angularis TaxID=3914 RepID=A0A0L9UWM6_PHAAN|nr:hypothetical protein LR48_Vigan07g087700 [Vigna angularis]